MQALRVTFAIWLREVTLVLRERSRIVGMIGQPLLYLLVLGPGMAGMMHAVSSGGGKDYAASPGGGIDYLTYMYPGVIGMSVLFTSIFSAMSIIWDREFGFLKEVLVSPAPRPAVAAGKILGGATVATMQAAILIALAPVATGSGILAGDGVWWTPSMVVELLLVSFLISCAMTSLGVAIASRMRSMQGFQMVMNFLVMPLYFLSGAIFTTATAPWWMQPLMRVDPLTYGVDALRMAVYAAAPALPDGTSALDAAYKAGLISGTPLIDVGVLAATALVLGVFAGWRFSSGD